jgi:hypothetical protein
MEMFLRNVGWLSPDYTALYPRIYKFKYIVDWIVLAQDRDK